MKTIKLTVSIVFFSMLLFSCEETCIRCINSTTQDEQSQCFSDDEEKEEYIATREALGYTCN